MKITKETVYRFITVTLKYIDRPKLTALMDKYGNRRNAVDDVTVYNLFMTNKAFSRQYLTLVRGLETRNPEFRRDLENGTVVRVDKGRIELFNEKQIKSWLKRYIAALPHWEFTKTFSEGKNEKSVERQYKITASMVMDVFTNFSENLIDSNLSNLRETENLSFLQDTRKRKFLFFKNKIVMITKSGCRLLEYSDNYNIWKNQIIQRDITLDESRGVFYDFIEKITGGDEKRILSLRTVLGYLMHYNFNTNLKAVYFADENEDFDLRGGRSGKGILGKAIKHTINSEPESDTTYVAIPGEYFSSLKLKRYMTCEANTQVVHIEDAVNKSDVTPDKLVSDITEGISILKHYGSPHQRYAKIMISTNFAVDFAGSTHKGRAIVYELKNYFNAQWTPLDEYKCMFFSDDWDTPQFKDEWNRFYTFMINCCYAYMQHGLIAPETLNYENRVIYETTNEMFVIWMTSEVIEKRCKNSIGELIEYKIAGSDLFDEYMNEKERAATLSSYKQPPNQFCEWIKRYCRNKNIRFSRYQATPIMYYFNPTKENADMIDRQRKLLQKK